MRVAYLLGGGGVFISPTPINYLHVKYVAPLLRLASEIVRKKSGESEAQSGVEFGFPV